MSRRPRPRALLLAAAVATACLSLAAGSPEKPRPFVPDPEHAQGATLQGRTWTGSGESWTIHLRRLDEQERQNYIERMTGLRTDPFASRPGHAALYQTFLLVVENRGEGQIQINPLHSWLRTNKKKIRTPRSLTDLSFEYRMTGRELPPAYERTGPILLDKSRAIAAGESLSGLLVYEAIDPETRSFEVDVQLTLPNGDAARMTAPYRKLKKNELPPAP